MVLIHQITQQIQEINAHISELEQSLIVLDCTQAKLESLISERNELLKLQDELVLEGCLLGYC
jgi:prefoldin subunit 5